MNIKLTSQPYVITCLKGERGYTGHNNKGLYCQVNFIKGQMYYACKANKKGREIIMIFNNQFIAYWSDTENPRLGKMFSIGPKADTWETSIRLLTKDVPETLLQIKY